ncbi:Na(+)/H(+) antiporter subunit F1 [Paenibacillus sp. JCM 10914]|uniref:Na(+)/H(+) antiporter subunit F1 n=1 Tax=Paenibacillus sp. JCM 10914 TaxID=1236974 RepID=UPI0003CC9E42|nr:Na(+)/H(+) antiporter subunit F1 [Paenibacillus sp. JCM 10914]GAE05072.1 acetyltransferase [Paenibacillus sp. JCM 10914]
MINGMLIASLLFLSLGIIGCLYRLLKGPSINDRIMSLDTIGILMLSMIAVLGMKFKTSSYFDIILLIGILTFIGTTAFSRYIERGDVIERVHDEPDR